MGGYEGYGAIARVYDKLNEEIDYAEWADFIEKCFGRFLTGRPGIVLDLACGTGRMTSELAGRGYDMIGVDGSADMLAVAYSRALGKSTRPLYLMQDMRALELYGTVGATVCCLDSINYLTETDGLEKTFDRVHNYLDPGGLFLFDVNTPYKFKNIYGNNSYILEDEDESKRDIFCAWQNEFDPDSGICDFYLSLFEENDDGSYNRSDEHQREKCWSLEELTATLEKCGFEFLGAYGGYGFEEPDDKCERWYIAARAVKSQPLSGV